MISAGETTQHGARTPTANAARNDLDSSTRIDQNIDRANTIRLRYNGTFDRQSPLQIARTKIGFD